MERHIRRVAVTLALALALVGGASRADEWQQAVAHLSAIAAAGACLWPLRWDPWRGCRQILWFMAAMVMLGAAQLIPLPPAIWTGLPGHAMDGHVAALAGSHAWRPISLTPDLTLASLAAMLPALAGGFVGLGLGRRGHLAFGLAVLAIAVASAALGLMQLAIGDNGLHLFAVTSPDAPVGLMANRNHQAALLAAALPMVGLRAGLWLRAGRRASALAVTPAVPLLLVILVLCGSRMGSLLACVGIAGMIAAWRACGQRIIPQDRSIRMAAFAAALVLATGLGLIAWHGQAVGRLGLSLREETRITATPVLLQAASAYAPLGSGLGSFADIYRRFEPDSMLSSIWLNEAHDEPVQIAIEAGVPGLVLLSVFLVWWVRRWPAGLRAGGSQRALTIAYGTFSAIFLLGSLVDYPLRTPLLGALFALACAVLARSAATADEPA